MGDTNECNQLKNLIKYSYSEVDYYHTTLQKADINPLMINSIYSLSEIPFLKKEHLQDFEQQLVAKPFQRFPGINGLEVRRAVGVDGKLVKTFWSHDSSEKTSRYIWNLRKNAHGINPGMKYCQLHGVCYKGNKLFNQFPIVVSEDGQMISFSIFDLGGKGLHDLYLKMLEFKPKWMLLCPGMAEVVTDFINENNYSLPACLEYIEIRGTGITEVVRRKIETIFNVDTSIQLWMPELGTIAYSCEHNRLHVINQCVIVECLKDGKAVYGIEGDIYITSLTNFAMPLIRYETGLRGILHTEQCFCGTASAVIEITPPENVLFNFANGAFIASEVIDGVIEITNENMQNCIRGYRAKKIGSNELHVDIILKSNYKGWGGAVIDSLKINEVYQHYNSINWSFNITTN